MGSRRPSSTRRTSCIRWAFRGVTECRSSVRWTPQPDVAARSTRRTSSRTPTMCSTSMSMSSVSSCAATASSNRAAARERSASPTGPSSASPSSTPMAPPSATCSSSTTRAVSVCRARESTGVRPIAGWPCGAFRSATWTRSSSAWPMPAWSPSHRRWSTRVRRWATTRA